MSVTTGRRRLNLLAQRVNARDLLKVTAFLRLATDRLRGDWQISASGETHLLLMGQDEATTILGLIDDPVSVLRIVDDPNAADADPSVLTRPIQYDAFVDALLAVEDKLLDSPSAASSVPAANALPAPAPVPAVPARVPTPSAASTAATLKPSDSGWTDSIFRLRQWPPANLLQKHRYGVRLASFLSVRHVGLPELARLSNVTLTDCLKFVRVLGEAGLLYVEPAPAKASRSGAAAPAMDAQANPNPTGGLVDRIRRSLGMTTVSR